MVCRCIWQFTTNIPRPYLPLYIEVLGGTPANIGVVNFASAIAGLFLYPLGGYIADKEGRVRLVGIATFLYAFSFIPFAYAPNWQTLAVASFFQNLVLFYAPILTVLQADSMPAGMRTQGFAIAVSVPGALGIVSPLLGGYLVDKMGIAPAMHITYLVGFGAGIIVAFVRMYMLEETLDPSIAQKIDYRNMLKLIKDSYGSFIETLKWMPEPIKVLAVMQMMQFFFNGLAGAFYIVYATSLVGISATSWGFTSAIQGGVRLLIATPAGRLMDKIGRRRLLIPFMALTPFYPLVFLLVKDFTQLALLVVVMAVGNAF
ncbi:MFS transporter, partial [Candidatus Bathyarchaeota archaeon]|nr:MFS transporter [Candidatus Bathyarchaeota archaeon]